MSEVKVVFFASLRETVGVASMNLDAANLAAMWAGLEQRLPPEAIGALRDKNVRLAVNQTLVDTPEVNFCAGDEVAFLPPVTGG